MMNLIRNILRWRFMWTKHKLSMKFFQHQHFFQIKWNVYWFWWNLKRKFWENHRQEIVTVDNRNFELSAIPTKMMTFFFRSFWWMFSNEENQQTEVDFLCNVHFGHGGGRKISDIAHFIYLLISKCSLFSRKKINNFSWKRKLLCLILRREFPPKSCPRNVKWNLSPFSITFFHFNFPTIRKREKPFTSYGCLWAFFWLESIWSHDDVFHFSVAHKI